MTATTLTGRTKTYRPHSYPGDTFVRIDVEITHGANTQMIPVLGINRKHDSRGSFYANDRNGRTFATIADARKYAIVVAQSLYPAQATA